MGLDVNVPDPVHLYQIWYRTGYGNLPGLFIIFFGEGRASALGENFWSMSSVRDGVRCRLMEGRRGVELDSKPDGENFKFCQGQKILLQQNLLF